jgi:hypothetical protein
VASPNKRTYCQHSGAMGYNVTTYCNGLGLLDLEHGPKQANLIGGDVTGPLAAVLCVDTVFWTHTGSWAALYITAGWPVNFGTGTRQRVNGRGTWEPWNQWNAARHLVSSDTSPRRGFVLLPSSKAHSRCRRRTGISFLSVIGSAGISCMTIATQGPLFTEAVHNNEINGKRREKRGDGKLA